MAEKKVTKDDLFWMFVRSNFLLGSFNFERMQAMGFCVAMMPILKRVYSGND
jgi:PTS system mannose-specific IID component